ncbi:MAG: type I restriction endonuclease subunit R, partial [Synergistaceae bacterium]|nr:type I restriction endonuclease subunit R [Synergistaceae bacterium]
MTTDMREKGLEDQCVAWLVETNGYELGVTEDYNRKLALDETRLMRFLEDTQGAELDRALGEPRDETKLRKMLDRVTSEIAKRGVVDVLRKGVDFQSAHFTLFYLPGSVRNEAARFLCARNVFSVIRQLKYAVARGRDNLALDLALFVNGVPVVTCELKNLITRQNVNDAVEQYQTDRDPNEPLFRFKRCMAHFAVDDAEARFCTKLEGAKSWFLPFNRGYQDGAGNPPVPGGMRTEYLWKEVFAKDSLTDIIGNFAQVAKEKDQKTGRETEKQIFPRYHQLDAVRKLLASVRAEGIGRRYLVQHSTGSGKSNSIAWLAHQLAAMQDAQGDNVVASVVVVTDRVNLDRQIKETIRQFMQVSSTVGWATASGQLARFLADGKRIIITTIQKFPFILKDIGDAHRGRRFAIIIDEAHSSQSGSLSLSMHQALKAERTEGDAKEEEEDPEDIVRRIIESRPLLKNASYFAFTA